MGVSAFLYPHQLANVHRILSDVRVRHLLADEVGLGKTVQALMVLNALRCGRPTLKAIVVVPDQLVSQWRDEIMTRTHTAPIGDKHELEGTQYIRLAWDAQRRVSARTGVRRLSPGELDPMKYDVLVVDELHRLSAEARGWILRCAPAFEHVLVLTATPAFQDPSRHAQLLEILEPEASFMCRREIARSKRGLASALSSADDLSKWPDWAAGAMVSALVARDQGAADTAHEEELGSAALASCAYRRVVRTRREDYPGVLPRRRHLPLVVEPIGAEADRQALMWKYFAHLDDLTTKFDPVLLAKRVILSPTSLEQRVDFFRRKGHEREGLLERVKPLVHRRNGDSRADALVDLLRELWATNPAERVLVAAQDNLTVDYLFDLVQARLPLIGEFGTAVPLLAARVRQGQATEVMEDLGGSGNETNENLEMFQRGDAQVLFAPEAAQVGLNLQRARVLVLYSVPWEPEEVEQWIGRLDRIGNEAAFFAEDEARSIDVYTIAQRGLVDEKVVRVLQSFHVFERGVNLDGDHVEEVARLIEAAALRPGSVDWRKIEEQTEVMAAEDAIQELESPLRRHLPWDVGWTRRLWRRLAAMGPVAPVLAELPEHSREGPRAWDRAFEGMVRLLKRGGDYHIRWNTDPEDGFRFLSLWYRFGSWDGWGHRPVESKVIFSFGGDPGHERSPLYSHAFITRRGDIGTPPRRRVGLAVGAEESLRPLRFLSHGDPLHDELVDGWLPSDEGLVAMRVTFGADHSIWVHGEPGLYIIRIVVLDPASVLATKHVEEGLSRELIACSGEIAVDRYAELLSPFRCAVEADTRWLRAELPATMIIEGRRSQGGVWGQACEAEVAALLNPLAQARGGLPQGTALEVGEKVLQAVAHELDGLRSGDSGAARRAWAEEETEFGRGVSARLAVIDAEGREALAVAKSQVEDAREVLSTARGVGNASQVSRAETVVATAVGRERVAEILWQERLRWLERCREATRAATPDERVTAVLQVQASR